MSDDLDVAAMLEGLESPAVEVPPAVPVVVPPVEAKPAVDLTASRNLAQKAAEARRQFQDQQESKARKAEFEEYRKEAEEARELKRLAKDDRIGLLEKLGLKYEDIGVDLLTGKRPGPTEALQARLDALEGQLAEKQAKEDARQLETDFDAVRKDVESQITQKMDDYEYINTGKHYEMVFDTVQAHFHETGEIDVDGAAQQVEAYLESIIGSAAQAKKFSKFVPREAPGQPRTLTQTQATSIPSHSTASKTNEELFAEALEYL